MFSLQLITPMDGVIAARKADGQAQALGVCLVTGKRLFLLFQPDQVIITNSICVCVQVCMCVHICVCMCVGVEGSCKCVHLWSISFHIYKDEEWLFLHSWKILLGKT